MLLQRTGELSAGRVRPSPLDPGLGHFDLVLDHGGFSQKVGLLLPSASLPRPHLNHRSSCFPIPNPTAMHLKGSLQLPYSSPLCSFWSLSCILGLEPCSSSLVAVPEKAEPELACFQASPGHQALGRH